MSADASKSKLTFAKVAAAANAQVPQTPKPKPALPPSTSASLPVKASDACHPLAKDSVQQLKEDPRPAAAGFQDSDPTRAEPDETFTPRQHNSVLVRPIETSHLGGRTHSQHVELLHAQAEPVSEENVTKISSLPPLAIIGAGSMDARSTASGTTFPLDEKESLRPDDSASVQAGDEDDARTSQVSSNSDARAFSEQLREIAGRTQPLRHNAAPPRFMHPVAGALPLLFSPTPGHAPGQFGALLPNTIAQPVQSQIVPDEKLLEAMSSVRDRVWVLKLEQDITDFVKDPAAPSFDLPQCNSFYRMLAHKMADYYLLGHTMDSTTATVQLWKTPNCRIPPRLSNFATSATAESTPPPPLMQMKILRRSDNETRSSSRDGLRDGDSGSDAGRGAPATREEREARYEAARLRILGSAKPSEDGGNASLSKDNDHSNPNSVVEKKRNQRKQRTDSDDGFEARSVYSMYQQHGDSAAHGSFNKDVRYQSIQPGPYDQAMPYMPSTHGYAQPALNGSWYNAAYGPAYAPQPDTWSRGSPYDLSMHMQAMSFQPAPVMHGYSNASSSSTSSPHMHPVPPYPYDGHIYGPMSGQWSHQHNGQQPYAPMTRYPYGTLPPPSQIGQAAGRRPNLTHPLPGSYVRHMTPPQQPYFNPQSQTFIPGQMHGDAMHVHAGNNSSFSNGYYGHGQPEPGFAASPSITYVGPAYGQAAPGSYGTSLPSHAQMNYSTQSQPNGIRPQPQQHNHHHPRQQYTSPAPDTTQGSGAPTAMTHPLPQPVFAQKSMSNGQQHKPPALPTMMTTGLAAETQPAAGGHSADGAISHGDGAAGTVSVRGLTSSGSALAKYDGKAAGLPAKPPPTVEASRGG